MNILLVEDDTTTASFIQKGLNEQGYVVDHVADGESGLHLGLNNPYDAMIIDRMLPEMDGLSIIRMLRKQDITTPVLILSALGEVDNRVEGLQAGGDDYLVKPYAFSELHARLQALLRRAQPTQEQTVLKLADLEMDLMKRQVKRADTLLNLQPREFTLLEYLLRNTGQVVTRTMLLEKVWDYHFDPQTNVIDVHISRLRGKIDKGFNPPLLHTIRGAGYILHDPSTA
uniref:Response regulator in two-component regulatory system with PhoQ n=1 Tax=uncultured Thiotrichaceae bacterium TaxID=298394 RepID=A0A6S6TRY4_9GAMM|nr:MAG: response regulator in two-component regulatory system with PhoQ [uncultured Thiotrichaceae bacterium]